MRNGSKAVLGVIVAILVVGAAMGGWLLRQPGSGADASTVTQVEDIGVGVPTIVSPQTLEEFTKTHYPLYWAGEIPDTDIELTLTTRNGIFVRYLPSGTEPGAEEEYLTVATYDAIDGFAALSAAKKKDATVEYAQNGAAIAVFKNRPLSTYFSFENGMFQVEVYSPDDGESKRLTDDGSIVLVDGASS